MLKLFEQEYDCKIKHGFELDFVTLLFIASSFCF